MEWRGASVNKPCKAGGRHKDSLAARCRAEGLPYKRVYYLTKECGLTFEQAVEVARARIKRENEDIADALAAEQEQWAQAGQF